ncbi:MAG: hypothetical protein ABSF44_12750 [Candidatus Bathyarchaeia archaeon]|jgi:LPXTG-motif cell wall-anchored protein
MEKAVKATLIFLGALTLTLVVVAAFSPRAQIGGFQKFVTLPTITILRTGSIQSSLEPVPISVNGSMYTLTGNIENYSLDIQCSNLVLNGAGYWISSNLINWNTAINLQANQVKISNLNVQGFYSPLNITGSDDVITQTYLFSQPFSSPEITVNGSNDSFVGNKIVSSLITTTDYNYFVENNITRGGVELYGTHNQVSENVFYSSGVSLWGQTSFNTIVSNTFNTLKPDNSSFGISISGKGMQSNTIYLNNFMSNVVPVIDVTDPAQALVGDRFDNGSVGNYWSNYAAKNPNARELGTTGTYNTPYLVFGNIIDNHPLTSPSVEKITIQIPNPTPLPTGRPATNNASQNQSLLAVATVAILVVAAVLLLLRRRRKTTNLSK